IDAKDLPIVQLGDSDGVRVGQFAFAIGAPFKLDYTFTYGVVSGKGRNKLLATGGYSISDYLQTDASINPGNSGGPLCDIDGKVIGMNTLINGMNRGLGFAIPSNMAKEIGAELIAGHKIVRPWLGIRIETLGDDPSIRDLLKGADKGVVVRTIEADAPAYKSDVRPFDVITHVDGTPVETDSQLQHEVLKKKVGQNVELTIWRKGRMMKVPVKAGELPNEITRASNEPIQPAQPKEEDTGKFGLQVQELTKEVAERLHLAVQRGVIVTDVADNSLAAQQDIQREDIITEVDGKPVTDVKSFREALTKADPRRGVLLYLDRKGGKTFAVLKAGNGRVMTPNSQPEKGSFYRADHFEFSKRGVPALYTGGGKDFIGKPTGFGQQKKDDYIAHHYNLGSDDVNPEWDLPGTVQDVDLLFEVGYQVANGDKFPESKPGAEFKPKRDEM